MSAMREELRQIFHDLEHHRAVEKIDRWDTLVVVHLNKDKETVVTEGLNTVCDALGGIVTNNDVDVRRVVRKEYGSGIILSETEN